MKQEYREVGFTILAVFFMFVSHLVGGRYIFFGLPQNPKTEMSRTIISYIILADSKASCWEGLHAGIQAIRIRPYGVV